MRVHNPRIERKVSAMKIIISKLYDGEIFPSEQFVSNDPRYWPMIRNISRERELLKARDATHVRNLERANGNRT